MNNIPLPKTIKLVKTEGNTGQLVIEPCFPGFGTTMANALRRVLLSSLSGAAVTSVRIKGVDHEFSAIEGVKEDVVNIVLNLKLLRFKVHTEEPVTLNLKAKGEKVVTAKDIKGNSQVDIANPEQVIATLTDKKSELDMEIIVSSGIGYLPVETREKEDKVIGDIKVDATFTPVDKVSYNVENVRVGQETNYDRVILDITTDGTTQPREALERAGDILVDHFCVLAGITEVDVNKKKKKAKTAVTKVAKKPAKKATKIAKKIKVTDAKVEDLKITNRTLNALLKAKYKKLSSLSKLTEEQFLNIPGVGSNALKEIQRHLKKHGFEGFKDVK